MNKSCLHYIYYLSFNEKKIRNFIELRRDISVKRLKVSIFKFIEAQ